MSKTILVTGAGGYIGGQCVFEFKDAGYTVVGLDREWPLDVPCDTHITMDYGSKEIELVLKEFQPNVIVHCAGTSLVGPSIDNPGEYYENNVAGTARFLRAIVEHTPDTHVIFASSAAVYGEPTSNRPLVETDPCDPISPYGHSKLMLEQVFKDFERAHGLKFTALRFFNICGADPQGRYGQLDDATHIIPSIIRAVRNGKAITINGNDYNTADGTCVRDYVHVCDLSRAIKICAEQQVYGIMNVGSKQGYSVAEVVDALDKQLDNGVGVIEIGPRRIGDPDRLTADASELTRKTNWIPEYNLENMVKSAWTWHTRYKITR